MEKKRVCKDCQAQVDAGLITRLPLRLAEHPGPRCTTHHRAFGKRQRADAHDKRVQAVYGLEPGEYEAMYTLQGGVCAFCRRATGKTKRLAVDHDHETGQPRGLLCGPCNQILGHGRDNPQFFMRIINYLNGMTPYMILKKETQ